MNLSPHGRGVAGGVVVSCAHSQLINYLYAHKTVQDREAGKAARRGREPQGNDAVGGGADHGEAREGRELIITDELAALKATKVLRDFQKRERERKSKREFTSRKVGKGMRIWRVR